MIVFDTQKERSWVPQGKHEVLHVEHKACRDLDDPLDTEPITSLTWNEQNVLQQPHLLVHTHFVI